MDAIQVGVGGGELSTLFILLLVTAVHQGIHLANSHGSQR